MESKRKMFLGIVSVSLALVLALGLGISAVAANGTLSTDQVKEIVETTTDQSLITSPVLKVAQKAKESVVGVVNYQVQRSGVFGYDFGSPFGEEPENGERGQRAGTGSGTVISAFGHVLTNYHVIENADRVTVTEGETELDATVVGSDANLDIAILLVPGLELPAVPLGDSDAIQVGEYAIVIGNPLGQQFERSVTVGFVSAVSRTMEGKNRDRYGLMSKSENKMIQVDAAISSGNSGGGLFNTLGQLQGIPSMKLVDNNQSFFSPSSYSIDNIGMCVPINAAKPLIKSVLESFDEAAAIAQAENRQAEGSQNPARPRIGVTVATMAPSYLPVAQGLLPQGAYVVAVEANSPAETAGLQAGDIVVEANGDIVKTQTQLIEKLQTLKEGDFAQLKVYRVEGLPEALEDSNLLDSLEQGEYMDFSVQLLMLDPVGM